MKESPNNTRMSDYIAAMMNGTVPPPPVAQLVGFTLTDWKPGEATMQMKAEKRHTNPMGTLHGGIMCDIADAGMGIAYASTLEEGETFTTLELSIHFLRPVWEANITARAKVVSKGRTVGLVECDLFDEENRLVAQARSTCLTLRGKDAAGR